MVGAVTSVHPWEHPVIEVDRVSLTRSLQLAARPGLLPDNSCTPCGDNRTLALTARSASLCHLRQAGTG